MMHLLFTILREKKFFFIALIAAIVYLLLYLFASQFLIISSEPADAFFDILIVPDWKELLIRQRIPFTFESIGSITITPYVQLFLAIPNLIIGSLLSLLVGLNVMLSAYSISRLRLKGLKGLGMLFGTIPAIASGAACCVPVIILVLGIQLSIVILTIFAFFIPLAFLLLILTLWWSLHRIVLGKY